METSERLLAKAYEYELLAAFHAERASVSVASGPAAAGFTVVAIVLREVANALDEAA